MLLPKKNVGKERMIELCEQMFPMGLILLPVI